MSLVCSGCVCPGKGYDIPKLIAHDHSRYRYPPTGQLLALHVLSVLVLELLCKFGEMFGDSRELSIGAAYNALASSGKNSSLSSSLLTDPTISGLLAFLWVSNVQCICIHTLYHLLVLV